MNSGKSDDGIKRIVKVKKTLSVNEIATVFTDLLPEYIQHTARIKHQYNAMKEVKSRCSQKCILVHIDFSENYQCKYAKEIQSIHFGGNRIQVSLHIKTGLISMVYGGGNDTTEADHGGVITPPWPTTAVEILKWLSPLP